MKLRASSRYSSLGLPGTLALFAFCSAITHCGSDDPPTANGSSGKAGSSGSSGMSGGSGRSGNSGTGATDAASGSGGTAGSVAGGSAGASGADAASDALDSSSDTSEDGGASGNPDASDAAEDVFVDPTVRGTLRTPQGRPLEGLTVLVGQSTTVSNARGEFTVDNVPPTYDLVVLPNSPKGATNTYVYIGLSSRRPVARVAVTETFLRTTIQGSLSPGYPQQDLQRTAIGFKGTGQEASGSVILEGGQGPTYGPLNVAWTFDTTIAGQLFALQWSVGASPFPTGYRGWVIQPTSLTSGMPVTANLALGTVTQREVTGTARFPQVTQSLNARLDVESVTVFNNPVTFSSGATSAPYAYPIPTLGSAARVLSFRATYPGGVAASEFRARVNDTSTTIDFELPSAPSLATPVDRATGVDPNTEFTWTPVPNAVYRLLVVSASTSTGLTVHTAGTTGKIPDLASKGVPMAPGNHIWTVEAAGPANEVDAFVSGTSFLDERGRELSAVSAYRNFTARAP
jgi:hypothetical protein